MIDDFLDKIREAASIVKDLNDGRVVRVVTHIDADGLASGGIICSALYRIGAIFHVRAIRQLETPILKNITKEHGDFFIFTDLGAGQLSNIEKHVKTETLVIDHHIPQMEDSKIVHLNPQDFGFDGSTEVSGAGVCYFLARELDKKNQDLSYLAVVGALGDRQDRGKQRSLQGLNKHIVSDGQDTGVLLESKEILLFGRETRPIHKALQYTTNPFIPGISGDGDACIKFLMDINIPLQKGNEWRTISDLTEEEQKKLVTSLITKMLEKRIPASQAQSIVGMVYTLIKEEIGSSLRDAREFSSLLNSCGRMNYAGLGISICLGDRQEALRESENVLSEYRKKISEYIAWLQSNFENFWQFDHLQAFHAKDHIDHKMIGTIASMAIASRILPSLDKPLFAFSFLDDEKVKVSARGTKKMVGMGMNLGDAVRKAAEAVGGEGGGHNIAAGCQIAQGKEKAFLEIANKMIGDQIGN